MTTRTACHALVKTLSNVMASLRHQNAHWPVGSNKAAFWFEWGRSISLQIASSFRNAKTRGCIDEVPQQLDVSLTEKDEDAVVLLNAYSLAIIQNSQITLVPRGHQVGSRIVGSLGERYEILEVERMIAFDRFFGILKAVEFHNCIPIQQFLLLLHFLRALRSQCLHRLVGAIRIIFHQLI